MNLKVLPHFKHEATLPCKVFDTLETQKSADQKGVDVASHVGVPSCCVYS